MIPQSILIGLIVTVVSFIALLIIAVIIQARRERKLK